MEQSNKVQRSEVWEQIYKVVKTLPRAECNGMDAPDAPSVATELEELFLKLLPIQHVSVAKHSLPRPLECWNKAREMECGDYIEWHLEKERGNAR